LLNDAGVHDNDKSNMSELHSYHSHLYQMYFFNVHKVITYSEAISDTATVVESFT